MGSVSPGRRPVDLEKTVGKRSRALDPANDIPRRSAPERHREARHIAPTSERTMTPADAKNRALDPNTAIREPFLTST